MQEALFESNKKRGEKMPKFPMLANNKVFHPQIADIAK